MMHDPKIGFNNVKNGFEREKLVPILVFAWRMKNLQALIKQLGLQYCQLKPDAFLVWTDVA